MKKRPFFVSERTSFWRTKNHLGHRMIIFRDDEISVRVNVKRGERERE